jgi:hypothetical protein
MYAVPTIISVIFFANFIQNLLFVTEIGQRIVQLHMQILQQEAAPQRNGLGTHILYVDLSTVVDYVVLTRTFPCRGSYVTCVIWKTSPLKIFFTPIYSNPSSSPTLARLGFWG